MCASLCVCTQPICAYIESICVPRSARRVAFGSSSAPAAASARGTLARLCASVPNLYASVFNLFAHVPNLFASVSNLFAYLDQPGELLAVLHERRLLPARQDVYVRVLLAHAPNLFASISNLFASVSNLFAYLDQPGELFAVLHQRRLLPAREDVYVRIAMCVYSTYLRLYLIYLRLYLIYLRISISSANCFRFFISAGCCQRARMFMCASYLRMHPTYLRLYRTYLRLYRIYLRTSISPASCIRFFISAGCCQRERHSSASMCVCT